MTNTNHNLPKGTSDEHYTPKEIFQRLNIRFDLDVAAPVNGSPDVPANQWFDKEMNGLEKEWFGNVWMNPPYSNPTPWVHKFVSHGNGIALLPITRGKWWDLMWNQSDAIIPLVYNQKFNRPDGELAKPIVFRTALYAIGQANVEAVTRFGGGLRLR